MSEITLPVRGLAREVAGRVGRRWGTRLGLAWIVVLVLCAVFAPFIATSFPLLLEKDGHWSSPAIENLSASDVLLQFAFWTALILWPIGMRPMKKLIVWAVLLALAAIPALVFVHASELVVYEQYRDELKSGQIQHVIFAPIPYSQRDHLSDVEDARLQPPDGTHWMGTTQLSADLLSNMIHATRIALSIGFLSTSIAAVLGILVGGLMGYFVGWVDLLGLRLVEILDTIPIIVLLLCLIAFFGANLYFMMAIIGLATSPMYAYYVRAEFLSLRERDFVHAARAAGVPLHSIIFRHMLLNGLTPIIVTVSFGVASAILYESTLSFLGIGLTDESSWGALLEEAVSVGGSFSWWIALYPGLAIFLTVLAYNLIGEALRDALDPKLSRMM